MGEGENGEENEEENKEENGGESEEENSGGSGEENRREEEEEREGKCYRFICGSDRKMRDHRRTAHS